MKLVASVCGMEHNPISFLRRAEHLARHYGDKSAASYLKFVANTVEREECQFTIAQAIAEAEHVGFHVIGHVTNGSPLWLVDDEADISQYNWYTVEFMSAMNPDAGFTARLAGANVEAFVRDMESSGWWLWVGGHAG